MPIQAFTVGTTQVKVAGRSRIRTSLTIANADAANTAFFKDGSGVGVENGIPIPPNSNAIIKVPEDDPTSDWWVIADAAGTSIRVIEQTGRSAPR